MRKNKLDPYLEEIHTLVADGYSSQQIMNYLMLNYGVDVAQSQLLAFIKNHNMRLLIERGRHNNPVCKDCKYCLKFANYLDSGTILVCSRSNKQINHYAVTTSPLWCTRRIEEGGLANV